MSLENKLLQQYEDVSEKASDVKACYKMFLAYCWDFPFYGYVAVILLQIVMVSPGTRLVKNHEFQSRPIESQFKNTSPWFFM